MRWQRKGGMQRGSSEIKENGGIRKAEERLKERETGVGVEKRMENLCMWRIYIIR
jgi:hypothetical protein